MSSTSSNTDEREELDDDNSVWDNYLIEDSSVHPVLEDHIALFMQNVSSEKIVVRRHCDIQEVDIEMTLFLDFIKGSILTAWGINAQLPLILKLHLNSALYFKDENSTEVDVFQDVRGLRSGALVQLKNIAKVFCKEKFEDYTRQENYKSASDDLQNAPFSDLHERKAFDENAPSCSQGFLTELYSYIRQRLESLNDYCPICDKHHGGSSMLKPTVCSNPLCIFSSQTLGVMCQVTDVLNSDPEVVELLTSFTLAAVSSSRHKNVLRPFPAVMDSDSQDFLFSDDEDGIKSLRKVMTALSSSKFSNTLTESELKTLLSLHHQYCYPLLRWIISSNRSYILHLSKEKQIISMKTNHQFVLRNSPPREESNFRALAQQFGSFFAFHGSPIENWHSIIREGLIVASGTELQLHGAVGGKGIYVSPYLKTALRYAGRPDMKKASSKNKVEETTSKNQMCVATSKNRMCVALCEVIMGPGVRKCQEYWIIEKSQHICTRFFFLYTSSTSIEQLAAPAKNNVDSTSSHFVESVKNVLAVI